MNHFQNHFVKDNADESRLEMTLEEQRAIEEEVRKSGSDEAGAKALEQRKLQAEVVVETAGQGGVPAGLPGRDSGFCSEQDQKQKQQEQQNEEVSNFVLFRRMEWTRGERLKAANYRLKVGSQFFS